MSSDNEVAGRQYERKVWQSLYGPDPSCRENLLETKTAFKKLFAQGHSTDIKDLFEHFACQALSGVEFEHPFVGMYDVHPRAWEIILKHGKHYRPVSLRREKPQDWERQPLSGSCFQNALEVVHVAQKHNEKSRAVYVEGFAIGPAVYPMLHAWVGFGFSGRCYDWTFYAVTMFTRYFGVPFTYDEYSFMTANADGTDFSCMMLFRKDCFEQVEMKMREVLKKPRIRLIKPKSR